MIEAQQADRPSAVTQQGERRTPGWRTPWVRRYYLSEVSSYLQFLLSPGQSMLEIGCQDGQVLASLNPSRGVGLDPSRELVERARVRYPDLQFQTFDPACDGVEGTFDAIIIRHIVEFSDDVQRDVEHLRRFCHTGTRLILITRNYLWAPVLAFLERLGLKRAKGTYAWLTLNDLQSVLSLAGYEVVRKEYRTLLPVWIPVVSWVVNRLAGKLPGLWKFGVDQWVVAFPVNMASDGNPPTVSVVIPCRNERGTIESIVERTPHMGSRTELVFVEGHSTDGTLEELHAVKRRRTDREVAVLIQDGRGKGDAVRKGVEASTGELILILDADLSVAPEALPRFVDALVQGHCELALGSRLVYPIPSQAMQPLNMVANMFFGQAMSFVLGQQVKDTLCGTKAIWRRDYDRVLSQRGFFGLHDPFGDFDLIMGAAKLSLKIQEIPVHYHERVYGTTNIRRWWHGLLLSGMLLRGALKMKLQ